MKRVAIITNIPAPYRVDFFDFLQKNYKDYHLQSYIPVKMKIIVTGKSMNQK